MDFFATSFSPCSFALCPFNARQRTWIKPRKRFASSDSCSTGWRGWFLARRSEKFKSFCPGGRGRKGEADNRKCANMESRAHVFFSCATFPMVQGVSFNTSWFKARVVLMANASSDVCARPARVVCLFVCIVVCVPCRLNGHFVFLIIVVIRVAF